MNDTKRVEVSAAAMPDNGRWQAILARIDLLAISLSVLGLAAAAVTVVVVAMVEVGRMIMSIWGNHHERWLLVLLGMAIVWVAVRWKKLSIF